MKVNYQGSVRVFVNGSLRISCSNTVTALGAVRWLTSPMSTTLSIGTSFHATGAPLELKQFRKKVVGSFGGGFSNTVQGQYLTGQTVLTATFPEETTNTVYYEAGLGEDGSLETYVRFRDAEGVPAGVTVLKGEQLRIEYTILIMFPLETVATTEIRGKSTEVRTVAVAVTNSTSALLQPSYGLGNTPPTIGSKPSKVYAGRVVGGEVEVSVLEEGSVTIQYAYFNVGGRLQIAQQYTPPIAYPTNHRIDLKYSIEVLHG